MRYAELVEATTGTHRVYHGTDYEIDQFRLDNLRHRTGTPGTLSFTTSLENAQHFGTQVYEVEVRGRFGDYLDRDDCDKVFAVRWPLREEELRQGEDRFHKWQAHMIKVSKTFVPKKYDMDEMAKEFMARISQGEYVMWENVWLWQQLGWDGAWCLEHNYRNLIIGNVSGVKILRKVWQGRQREFQQKFG